MVAPSSRSSRRLPSYSAGRSPLSASTARSPSRAETAATARQQLDCSVPQVMSVSAPWASASPTRNSSLRILLPVSSRPVKSSRLSHSSMPSSADRRSSFSNGVGACASSMRGIGGAAVVIRSLYSAEQVGRKRNLARGLPEQALEHEGIADGIVAVVVVEGHEHFLALLGERAQLRHERGQLGLLIEVVVLLADRRLLAAQLAQPALRVPPVQAHDGSRRRHRGD